MFVSFCQIRCMSTVYKWLSLRGDRSLLRYTNPHEALATGGCHWGGQVTGQRLAHNLNSKTQYEYLILTVYKLYWNVESWKSNAVRRRIERMSNGFNHYQPNLHNCSYMYIMVYKIGKNCTPCKVRHYFSMPLRTRFLRISTFKIGLKSIKRATFVRRVSQGRLAVKKGSNDFQ